VSRDVTLYFVLRQFKAQQEHDSIQTVHFKHFKSEESGFWYAVLIVILRLFH